MMRNSISFIVFTVDSLPKQIFQFGDTLTGNRRYIRNREFVGNGFLQIGQLFIIEHIAFRYGKDTMLVELLGIIRRQFTQQNIIIAGDIV